ncbi:hypothetical protein N657DRAFT_639156 [Parathielavia appendiculata]|uniref:Uncharacterized protein n=1 Tax=Parathielavia appendiculata TaxID=2587402 RepID=A0AAN6U9K6_9PEZI|nr:hypothetical protein N657DRAFT_639156 [Parathielavia appendiculata]
MPRKARPPGRLPGNLRPAHHIVCLVAHHLLSLPSHPATHQTAKTKLNRPVPSLNGLYITRSPNNSTVLGVFPNVNDSKNKKILFYPLHNPTTGLAELRIPASGDTLAVLGSNGLLDLASLADPAALKLPEGATCNWTSFRLELNHERDGGAAETGTVEYAIEGSEGRWVVFPAAGAGTGEGWSVKWKDVNAWTTANYMPVQVGYELVKEE